MSQSLESLRRKLTGAAELESVVRTMKAIAAASISQYEAAAHSLDEYYRAVKLGFAACLGCANDPPAGEAHVSEAGPIGALVFGSDQGLIGQFNDVVANFVASELKAMPGQKTVWVVGEYVHSRLAAAGLPPVALFPLPGSVNGITPLVGQILEAIEGAQAKGDVEQVFIFHNQPKSGALYQPLSQRLLPFDLRWRREISAMAWPTSNLPEIVGDPSQTLRALVREYLFVSLFRACAESLAAESTSRLAAMQRAEKNISDLLDELTVTFNRLRQTRIDEELFDVVSGFESASASESGVR